MLAMPEVVGNSVMDFGRLESPPGIFLDVRSKDFDMQMGRDIALR